MISIASIPAGEPTYDRVRIWINGTEAGAWQARVSALPFNTWWRGKTRPLDQTEIAGFVLFDMAPGDRAEICVSPRERVTDASVRPRAKGVSVSRAGNDLRFVIDKPGQYDLEMDGWHCPLYFFARAAEPFTPDARTLYFGPGVHTPGRIELASDSTVYIAPGAVVYGRLCAKDARNIRVLGGGILDNSRVARTAPCYFEHREDTLAVFENCENVELRGVTLRDSATFAVICFNCARVALDDVKVVGNWRYNSDGFDFFNCRNVRVRGCFLRTFDDTVVIKGQREFERMNAEDVEVSGCVLWSDWGHALEIGADIVGKTCRNVVYRDCDVIFLTSGAAMDITNSCDSEVCDIVYEDIRVEYRKDAMTPKLQPSDDVVYDLYGVPFVPPLFYAGVVDTFFALHCGEGRKHGRVRGVTLDHIQVFLPDGVALPKLEMAGLSDEADVRDVRIHDLRINDEPVDTDAMLEIKPFVRDVVCT